MYRTNKWKVCNEDKYCGKQDYNSEQKTIDNSEQNIYVEDEDKKWTLGSSGKLYKYLGSIISQEGKIII